MAYPYESATEEQRKIGAWWWCVHHEILVEPLNEPIGNRVDYILVCKPKEEHHRRLTEMRPVMHPERLPQRVVAALAEYDKAWAECQPELEALHLEEYPETKWDGVSILGGVYNDPRG